LRWARRDWRTAHIAVTVPDLAGQLAQTLTQVRRGGHVKRLFGIVMGPLGQFRALRE